MKYAICLVCDSVGSKLFRGDWKLVRGGAKLVRGGSKLVRSGIKVGLAKASPTGP